MVAKASNKFEIVNTKTGEHRVVVAYDKEELTQKVNEYLKVNDLNEDEVQVNDSDVGYTRQYRFGNLTFRSKVMLYRYHDLLYLQATGAITNLKVRPHYPLIDEFHYNGERYAAVSFAAEFEFFDTIKEKIIIEDYNSAYNTPKWRLLKKLFLYMYKDIAEIRFINAKSYEPIANQPNIIDKEFHYGDSD